MKSTRIKDPGLASRLLIAIAALWLPCACAATDAPPIAAAPADRIRALIGDAACDSDAQCRTLAVGAKACGGPEYYLPWSTKRTDGDALRDATLGAGMLPPPARRNPGTVSNCAVVTDPGAYCASSDSSQIRACRLRNSAQRGKGPVD